MNIAEFTIHCMRKNFTQIVDIAFTIADNFFVGYVIPEYSVEDITDVWLSEKIWVHNQRCVKNVAVKYDVDFHASENIGRNSIYLLSKDWVLRFELGA